MAHVLDDFDRQIIALLHEDGRLSHVEIGRRLGLAEGTVRKRLERLVSQNIIRVTAVVEPAAVGLTTTVLVSIQAELGAMESVARRIAQIPEVHAVCIITGTYDILVEVLLPSSDRLLSFLIDRISTIPGVRRTETSQVLQMVKRGCDWLIPQVLDGRTLPGNIPGTSDPILPGAIVISS